MKLLSINIFTDTIASFEDKCFADKRGEDASTAGSGQHEPPRLPQGVRAGPPSCMIVMEAWIRN